MATWIIQKVKVCNIYWRFYVSRWPFYCGIRFIALDFRVKKRFLAFFFYIMLLIQINFSFSGLSQILNEVFFKTYILLKFHYNFAAII